MFIYVDMRYAVFTGCVSYYLICAAPQVALSLNAAIITQIIVLHFSLNSTLLHTQQTRTKLANLNSSI